MSKPQGFRPTQLAVREMLKAEPGTKYDFIIGRADQEKKLKLELAELL